MLDIGSEYKSKFELVVQIRDNKGNPTGKSKAFVTDSGFELKNIWSRYSGKAKKKKKKADAAKNDNDIKIALKETESHIQKIRKKKNIEE